MAEAPIEFPTGGRRRSKKAPPPPAERLPVEATSNDAAAVLIVHGMGQQDRNATLSDVVRGLERAGGKSRHPIQLRTVKIDGEYLPCAQMRLDGPEGVQDVHVYEAYWAPLAVGKASLRSSIRFLLKAGWR